MYTDVVNYNETITRCRAKHRELQDTILSYQEMTEVKDQVVVSLTNEVSSREIESIVLSRE